MAKKGSKSKSEGKDGALGKYLLPALVVVALIAAIFYFAPPFKPAPMPGSDRDEHGCIGSAGFSWCENLQLCIQPWETDCATGAMKCKAASDCPPGAARCADGVCTQYDEHGCVPDGGYTWCEPLQKCIQPWMENCTEPLVGGDRDSHGCIGSAGYSWCEALQACIRPWETNCTAPLIGGDKDVHGCYTAAGYSWCEATQKCYRSWEENCTSTGGISAEAKKHCGEGNVFLCGNYIKVVSAMPGAGSTFYEHGTSKKYVCPIVAPEYMAPACSELLLGSNCIEKKVC